MACVCVCKCVITVGLLAISRLMFTFGKRLSSSIREMMFRGLAARRSRISWLSTN